VRIVLNWYKVRKRLILSCKGVISFILLELTKEKTIMPKKKPKGGRPSKYKNEAERLAAKKASDERTKKSREEKTKHLTRELTLRQKRFCALLPSAVSATQAAIEAGYSVKSAGESASENLKKSNVVAFLDNNLRQAFNEYGLNEDYLAKNFKRVIDYNQEEIIELIGFGKMLERLKKCETQKWLLVL
jgi:hypothetical protein